MAITRAQQAKQMLQDGGRIGFKGGADMGTVSTPTRTATAKSVSVSPSGGVTTSRTRGPDPVERPGTGYDSEKEDLLPGDVFDETIDLPKDDPRRVREENKDLFINKPGNYPKYIPPSVKFLANFNREPNRRFFYEKVLKNNLQGLNYTELEQAYEDYMSKRMSGETDAFGNTIPQRDDNNDPLIIPFQETQQPVQDPTTMLPQINPTFYRIMADGGMTDDAPMMSGGITDLALRDEFFLGGIVKGIKKGLKGVTRAVKKIAKSPVGKAALFAGVAGIPFGGGSFFGSGSLFGKASGLLKSQGLKDFFLKDAAKGLSGGLSTKGIITALTATPFIGELLGLNEQKEEPIYAGPGLDYNAQQFYRLAADGGLMRQEYDAACAVMSKEDMEKMSKSPLYKGFKTMYGVDPSMAKENEAYKDKFKQFEQLFKKGYQEGGDVEPVAKKTMPLLDMDGMEKDYREDGGFVPIGRMERADDVPARLSKNEFVFTADAVRNAGDGDVDKGAEVMYNMMKNLESGGDVSEESQGLDGAREMFKTSKRLEEVL